MNRTLPKDLLEAEILLTNSLISELKLNSNKYLGINLLFNNLRLNPIIKRLANKLSNSNYSFYLLWADEGGSALAKRDLPSYTKNIFSFNQLSKNITNIDNSSILIAVKPEPYDFEQFKQLCEQYSGVVIMINGRLEDMAVGIGNLGRERRKSFISLWKNVFWLEPLNKGALMKVYDSKWILYRLDEDGYRFCKYFDYKPDEEEILNGFSDSITT